MMDRGRLVLIAALSLAATLVIVAGSRLPWTSARGASSELRISWRSVAPSSRACRPPTEDEVRGLPQHMRPREVCEGGPVPFFYSVIVDEDTLSSGPASHPGGRGDLTLSVLDVHDVAPGRHRVRVDFWPDSAARSLPPDAATSLDRTVEFGPGRAVLVTMSDGQLVLRMDEAAGT